MRTHEACLDRANHTFVFLEDLIRQPNDEWARICQFLGLRPDTRLDDACGQTIADLEDEPWKRGAISGLPQPTKNKADDLFITKFKLWLDDHLESYDNLRAKCLLSRNSAARINHGRDSGKRMASISRKALSRQQRDWISSSVLARHAYRLEFMAQRRHASTSSGRAKFPVHYDRLCKLIA